MSRIVTLLFCCASTAATAGPALICGQESSTRKVFCVDPKAVAVNGDVRGGPLWTGGPNKILKTPTMVISNCQTGNTVLQDEAGVNIGAGRFGHQPPHMDDLYNQICALKPTKTDKRLRQF